MVKKDPSVTNGNSIQLNRVFQLFNSDGKFDNKVSKYLKLLSEYTYAQWCVFVPVVSSNIHEYLQQQSIQFGHETTTNNNPTPLSKSVLSLGKGKTEPFQALTSELDEETSSNIEQLGIAAFFIFPLKANNKLIGYISILETEITRIWSTKQAEDLSFANQIFAHFLHTEILEQDLFSKEDILQKAIENSNDGYWHIDLTHNKMHFSRQWKRMLGFDENEIEDSFETFENLLHPDDKDLVLQVLDPFMKIGVGSYECEYRIRNKNGNYIWVLTRANVNFSDNGIPLQFVATNTDITSRIQYKRKLAHSEAKYKGLIGSIHEIIFEIDHHGVFTFINSAWERQLLLKVDKSVGTESSKYIHPEDRAIFSEVLETPVTSNEPIHITKEIRFIAANGKSVWMEAHFTIKRQDQSEEKELKGTLININERKRVEIDKKSGENRLARISENIADLIVEIDESGKYLFISNAVRNMLGRNASEFIGSSSIRDIHPEDRDKTYNNIFKQLLNGAKRVVERYRLRNAEGGYIWVETIMQPLIAASGKRTFIAATRDISSQIKTEEDMKKALHKEKELNELKTRFLTMTSHEFRTPLSNIQSSVGLLEMYAEDLGDRFMKPFEKHFAKITAQVGRVTNLLNNIDTLGKIESSEMPFNPVKQNLVEFITNVINQQAAENFNKRTIDLIITGTPRVQYYDPNLFDNMICNILKNALLYSTEGSVTCEVVFAEGHFEVIITDEGIGIPEKDIPHLFTSFFRAKNIVNLNIPGNGLGLVISKRIAEIHHGTIDLTSEENVGTTVNISIPNQQK